MSKEKLTEGQKLRNAYQKAVDTRDKYLNASKKESITSIGSMTVDDFQTACEDNNIECSELDDMIYYLSIALKKE